VRVVGSFRDVMSLTAKQLRVAVITVSSFFFLEQVVAVLLGVSPALNGRAAFERLYTVGYIARAHQEHNLYDYAKNRRLHDELVSRNDTSEMRDVPAYEALVFAPFSFLSYRAAYITFFATNIGLLALSIWALRPFLDKLKGIWDWLPAVVFICFFPAAVALIEGEDSILLLSLMVASAVSFYRGRDVRAGVFLGLALFKLQLAVPVALLFLLWRRWRMVGGFVTSAVTIAIISVFLAGVGGLRVGVLKPSSWRVPLKVEELRSGIAEAPNLQCLFHALAGSNIPVKWVDIFSIGCSILLVGWAATRAANFALAVLVAILISTYSVFSDTVLIVIPLAMVLDARLSVSSGRSRLWSRNIAVLLFVAPLICCVVGLSYCFLAILMIGLLMPLRFTSSDSFPKPPVEDAGLLNHSLPSSV
jgi:hypothetical protein